MNKSTGILLGIACFFAGLSIGIIVSAVKNGFEIGNNSGNTINNYSSNEDV